MIFAKETRDGHASRVEVSFCAPLSTSGVDEENAFYDSYHNQR